MVFIAGTLFATGPSLARIASELGSLPLQTALWTNVVAAITCLGVSLRVYGAPRIRARHLRFCVIWALIYGCTYQVWLDVVATHVEASMIALVGSSRAFMVFALAALISLEKPTARRVIGLGSGMAAVAFVLAAEGALGGNASTPWLLATLGLPALLALHTLLMAWRPKELDAFATTGLMLVIASTLIAVAMALSDQPFLPEAAGGQLVLVILCRGAAGGLAISLAIEIVARAGAVFASQLAYVQTLAGIACGMILLDEQLPAAAWGALILIIFGFLLVQPRRAGDEFSVSIPIDRPTGHPPA
jgi:drug/metabolite transporter (DMT)-like permease